MKIKVGMRFINKLEHEAVWEVTSIKDDVLGFYWISGPDRGEGGITTLRTGDWLDRNYYLDETSLVEQLMKKYGEE